MVTKHFRKCSPSLAIREMQIKITLGFSLTTVRIAVIKNVNNDECWCGCGERGAIRQCGGECKLVQLLWKSVWRFPKNLWIKVLHDPSIYPWIGAQKTLYSTMEIPVHLCLLLPSSEKLGNGGSLDAWLMSKVDVVLVHNEISPVWRKMKLRHLQGSMDLEEK